MFCNKCGKNIPDDSTFCPACGASLLSGYDAPAADPYRPMPVYDQSSRFYNPREREASKSVLTFGILALAFSCTWVLSFVGIIFAFIARSKVKAYERDFGPATGKTRVGKIFSIVSIPLSIVMTVFFLIYIGIIAFAISYAAKRGSSYYRYW